MSTPTTLIPAPPRVADDPAPPAGPVGRGPRQNLTGHLIKGVLRVLSLVSVDILAVYGGRGLLRAVRGGALGEAAASFVASLLPTTVSSPYEMAVAVVLAMTVTGGYRAGEHWRQPVRILTGVGGGVTLALYAHIWISHPVTVVLRGGVVWTLLGITLVTMRNLLFWLTRRVPRPGLRHRVLEVKGANSPTDPLFLGKQYPVVAVLRASDLPNDMEAMDGWLEGGVDTIMVTGELSPRRFGQVADFALAHGCRLLCEPRSPQLADVEPRRILMEKTAVNEIIAPALRAPQLVLKRGVDIIGSALLLVLLSPVMLVVALAIRLDSPGPVLFRHRRAGYAGGFFELLKFRSMRPDAEKMLKADPELWKRYVENDFKLPESEDPRITPLGRFLRRSSLDELPQLLNVLKGDMSLVGPRPVVEPELEKYRGQIPTLLSVKPGVTGLWQVSGRSDVAFPERAQLDLEYVRRWSLVGDLWILFMTIPAVLYQRGAH